MNSLYGYIFLGFYSSFAVLCLLAAFCRYKEHKNKKRKQNMFKIIDGGKK